MKTSPARLAAFKVLLRIEKEKSFSSILLTIYESGLSAADRSLCHELTLGSLRRQIFLDRVIDQLSSGKKLDTEVRIAIRLGLYQLRFLDRVPAHSAVNESVSLIQMAGKTSAKGLVNAILRRAASEKPELMYRDEIEQLSVGTSHPRWLVEKWITQFGLSEATAIAAANNHVPYHAFRLIGNASEGEPVGRPSEFVEGCVLTDKIDSALIAAAEKGEIYLQDEGSQMVACSVRIPPDANFLDVCASPGGKTGLIAARSRGNMNIAVAGDLHWKRVANLRDNCRKQGVDTVNVVQYDAERPLPFSDASFDVVLVDVPCSGTGTIRHNPELRYFVKPGDLVELPRKQLRILTNASKLVTLGGTVNYSTCSLEREENEDVIQEFLGQNSDFQRVDPNVPGRFIGNDGFARTFPHRDGMDGFFLAELSKH